MLKPTEETYRGNLQRKPTEETYRGNLGFLKLLPIEHFNNIP